MLLTVKLGCDVCRSGGTLTACGVWEFQTRRTLPTSHSLKTPLHVSFTEIFAVRIFFCKFLCHYARAE